MLAQKLFKIVLVFFGGFLIASIIATRGYKHINSWEDCVVAGSLAVLAFPILEVLFRVLMDLLELAADSLTDLLDERQARIRVRESSIPPFPCKYHSVQKSIMQLLEECPGVLKEDGKRGKCFAKKAYSLRVRGQLLDLVAASLKDVKRCLKHKVTVKLYRMNDELESVNRCCRACLKVNRGKEDAECLVQMKQRELTKV